MRTPHPPTRRLPRPYSAHTPHTAVPPLTCVFRACPHYNPPCSRPKQPTGQGLLQLDKDTFWPYLEQQQDTLVVVDFYTVSDVRGEEGGGREGKWE